MIFLNCLIFCCFVPLISLIGSFYFYLKYLIDKYNLMFVYNKDYESGGKIRMVVTRYMYWNLLIYQLIAIFFFSQVFNDQIYLVFGFILIVFWAVVYFYGHTQILIKYNLDKILLKKQGASHMVE